MFLVTAAATVCSVVCSVDEWEFMQQVPTCIASLDPVQPERTAMKLIRFAQVSECAGALQGHATL